MRTAQLPESSQAVMPEIVSSGVTIDAVERLKPSTHLLGDMPALRERMAEDGYLFMPGLLDRQGVLEARREVCRRLADNGYLAPDTDPMDAIAHPTKRKAFQPDLLADDNRQLADVLHRGPLIEFFEAFLAEPVRYFDYTWFRSVPPGKGTASHCDIVYMGRGERERLSTVWTPIGDIDFRQGGLMMLPGSHRNDRLKDTYGQMDVDTYCENKPDAKAWGKAWGTGGYLKANPNNIARSLRSTWHTTEFRAGDVIVFTMFTVHASADNRSDRVRLSSDSRYQPASAPADERWIGPDPIGRVGAGRRGKIC